MFSQFLSVNFTSINDVDLVSKAQNLLLESFKRLPASLHRGENEDLQWIYYHSSIIAHTSTASPPPATDQGKTIALREYFVKQVLKPICENRIGVVSEIIHENGIMQLFNLSVSHSNM